MTKKEKEALLYGYLLRVAEESLEQGLFDGCTRNEVVEIVISEYLQKKG